jgi:hypothetical protein
MRPTTTNSPAGRMLGWGGTANPSAPTMTRLNALQDRPPPSALPSGGGTLPGKGSGSTLQPVAGGGNALASLFMGNTPAMSAQPAATLPAITQPRGPIIGMPPERRPLPQMPQTPPPLPHFNNLADLMGYTFRNPGKLSPEVVNMWKRSLQRTGGCR